MSEIVTPDDSCFCNLCDPPHETSIAMLPIHMRDVHGMDPDEIYDAPVIFEDEDEGDG